jgi:hypothetical protein
MVVSMSSRLPAPRTPRRWTVEPLDPESVERLRIMSPRDAYWEVKSSIYRSGVSASEDFQAAFEQLVAAGVLSWDQIEDFERD